MNSCFKNKGVMCHYENSCRNKSISFCRECSRNINRQVRDWFDSKETYKNYLKGLWNGYDDTI